MDEVTSRWDDLEWANEARQLVDDIKLFPEESKLIAILRHSHRLDAKDPSDMSKIKLTPLGHEIAIQFGKYLPINRQIRLYHSISPRCLETAEDILKGFQSISGKGENMGSIRPLYQIGGNFEFFKKKIISTPGPQFINRWAAGHYPPGLITPLSVYSQRAAFTIWKLSEDAPSKTIDIHITHDFLIMGLKFGWFGISPPEDGIPFLGGILMSFNDNEITLLDNGILKSIEIPYWWANMCL